MIQQKGPPKKPTPCIKTGFPKVSQWLEVTPSNPGPPGPLEPRPRAAQSSRASGASACTPGACRTPPGRRRRGGICSFFLEAPCCAPRCHLGCSCVETNGPGVLFWRRHVSPREVTFHQPGTFAFSKAQIDISQVSPRCTTEIRTCFFLAGSLSPPSNRTLKERTPQFGGPAPLCTFSS